MISTMSHSSPSSSGQGLPMEFQPNPLVTSGVFGKWSDETMPRMNVNRGATVWCQTNQILTEGSESLNQRLVGLADPKTLVEPMVSIPIFDTDVWKPNDFMIPKGINDQRRQELYQNGYLIDDTSSDIKEGYVHRTHATPSFNPSKDGGGSKSFQRGASPSPFGRERGAKPPSGDQQRCMTSSDLSNQSLYPNNASQPNVWTTTEYAQPFTTPYGYYPDQPAVNNLPTNYPAGVCQKQKDMASYNDNLFTSTLQPGVYSKSQVVQNDSVMSNLGISFTQPFLPTYSSYVQRKGMNVEGEETGVLYTQYDPSLAPEPTCQIPDTGVKMDQVYDPRFYGYGTDYRSYVDHLTGRPKFFYDDVDVHRRNKFITRNKLDFEPFGLQTGPQDQPLYTNMEIREMAQNSFLDNSLSFRTDLQQRLMQKSNNRAWQQKQNPIITNQFTRGGSSRASGLTPSGYAGPRG